MKQAPKLQRFDYQKAIDADSIDEFNDALVSAVCEDGVVIIEAAISAKQATRIVQEMRPFIETTPHGLHGLSHSRRVGALVARSPASHQAMCCMRKCDGS